NQRQVSVDQWHFAVEEELDAGHPLRMQFVEVPQARLRLFDLVIGQPGHSFDGHGHDVVVSGDLSIVVELYVFGAAVSYAELCRFGAKSEPHTESLQIRSPWRDPRVMRGSVQQSIYLRTGPCMIDPDLHANHSGGARTGAPWTHRHQRPHRDVA